jgi:hypothetical protein
MATPTTTAATTTTPSTLFMPDDNRLDVIPKLVSCTLFSKDETVVIGGLEELATLCYNVQRHEQIQSMAPDATTREEVMEYKKAVVVQDEIENINRFAMRDFGGHLAICIVMKHWWDSPNVQTACCKTLYYAAFPTKDNSTETFQDLAVHVGAIDIVLNGIHMYPNIEEVQLWGIRALLHLAWYERNYTPLVLEKQNGIAIFLNAMNTFPMSKDIQKAACYFLAKVCHNSQEIRDVIAKNGGRRVLLAAIENHPENEFQLNEPDSIQRNGRNTMKALCEPAEAPTKSLSSSAVAGTAAAANASSTSSSSTSTPITPTSLARKVAVTSNSIAEIPIIPPPENNHTNDSSTSTIGSLFKKINLF